MKTSRNVPFSDDDAVLQPAFSWFDARGWTPFPFQQEVWRKYLAGESGLIHAATGYGKTYAAWFGPLLKALRDGDEGGGGIRVLWITPLRALVNDTMKSLQAPLDDLEIPWRVERRTGDTSADTKSRQRDRLPEVLVTTPESLSLLLTYANLKDEFASLEAVIVDEWHELLGSKRGSQAELCLARLRRWCPAVRLWGVSATISNLDEALRVLVGTERAGTGAVVRGRESKKVVVDALLPAQVERFQWTGHVGKNMAGAVADQIDEVSTSLVFTNTRSNAEIWYHELLARRPEWAGRIAVHHGSIDRKTRRWIERSLSEGALRCVVCTSSLDLGVDFSPVERVFQVGSPKSVARILQRAGRSGHQPGAVSRITCVPTHALELVEFAAARQAAEAMQVEPREPIEKPYDVLVQHMVTVAIGGGFRPSEFLEEVRDAWSFRTLDDEEWSWALDFCTTGGASLRAYEHYRRVVDFEGTMVCASNELARRHRMSIGTIASDTSIGVYFRNGHKLGTVEESFVSRMKEGDVFFFAGRVLEFVRIRELKAYVRPGRASKGAVPRWQGGRMPLSGEMSAAMRRMYDAAGRGHMDAVEMDALQPILELQAAWSVVPREGDLLLERVHTRDGHHLFLYPFEGRTVHEGLAALIAWRMARISPITVTMSYNDYGIEFLSAEPAPLERALEEGLFEPENLIEDIESSINAAEMARRQFRGIARVAGLVFSGYPGRSKGAAQIQASSSLLFDVFVRHDPDNLLIKQARRQVREEQLEQKRLEATLERIRTARLVVVDVPKVSPLAFPILVDRLGQRLTTERLSTRIRRMQQQLELAADDTLSQA
ncbi:MAG: ligase-associated DNA damage response DEXH box helicase [Rhodothermales bacterium]|nr:ligase-associated DNA damage response DEXH box helicase [Rhodothermales bacterium]